MSAVLPATELVDLPAAGRRFTAGHTVRLGDVDPTGRLRLDATARHLQDVATDDADQSGLGQTFGWVVRRAMLEVRHGPVLGERLELTTFCSGSGRSWAERRTSIVGDRGGEVEAVALWVQVDASTGRPTGLGERFHEIYGSAAAGRRVSTRLTLPPPPADADRRPWTLRRVDLDVFDHVNNAVQWAILEEAMAEHGVGAVGRFEIEYLAPVGGHDRPLSLLTATADGVSERGLSVWLASGDTVRVAARATAGTRAAVQAGTGTVDAGRLQSG